MKLGLFSACIAALALSLTPTTVMAKKKDDSRFDRPYDKFFERVSMWTAVLSPDGTHLAMARRNEDDNNFVIIQDLTNPNAKPAGLNLGDELEIQWIEWANNDRLMYSVFKPWDGTLDGRPIIRLFGIDKDGKNNLQFFKNNKQINKSTVIQRPVSFIPSDPENVMIPVQIGDDLDVLKVNVDSGKSALAAKGKSNTRGWLADIDGNAAFYIATRDRARYIDYYSRIPGTNGKNAKFQLARSVRRDTTSNSNSVEFQPIGPAKISTQYYVVARPDGKNFAGVYLYDFEQNKYLQEIFTPKNSDVVTALIDEKTGTYEGAIYRDKGRVKYKMADKRDQAHMNALASYFGDSLAPTLISVSDDQSKMLFAASAKGDPGSYHLYDKASAFAEEVGIRMPEITANPVGKGKVVIYRARDGLELYGYLTQPTNLKPGEKAPLIMLPHGGPEARSDFNYSPGLDTIVQVLNWKGYQVFEPNFRGSTGRGLEFADKGRGQWGKAMQNDIDDGFAHLVAQGIADKDKACIMGFSYGGYAALAAATLTPNKYQCVVAGAAPADLFEMLRSEKADGGTSYEYWSRHIGDPVKDAQAILRVSPAQNAANIDDPVLIHHGDRDFIVPYDQGPIMVKAMEKAGKDVTFIKMKDIGHSFPSRKGAVRNEFYDGLLAFLDEHLPVD